MIHELNIKNLGIIESTQLNLTEGFNVITGETGAGKTMLLSGINFIRGGKIDSRKIREGSSGTSVEGVLTVDNQGLLEHLSEADVEVNDNEVVAVRSTNGSRSKTVLGGRSVPVGLLKDCIDSMMTVHGQAEQNKLRSGSQQRNLVDEFGGEKVASLLKEYSSVFKSLKADESELETLLAGKETFDLKISKLQDDLNFIEDVSPKEGEEDIVTSELRTMLAFEDIQTSLTGAILYVDGNDEYSPTGSLSQAISYLDDSDNIEELKEIRDILHNANALINEASSALSAYSNNMEYDEAKMNSLQERKSALNSLSRRLGLTFEDVLEYWGKIKEELSEGSNWEERISALEEKIKEKNSEALKFGKQLSKLRKETAKQFSGLVNEELSELSMRDSIFSINVTSSNILSSHGLDNVEMMLAGHAKAEPLPLNTAASGGELSRVMLAIEVSLASVSKNGSHTFIFDEIDAGVGGKAAVSIGRRLKKLSLSSQVIVVTHLAQVAAWADNHVVIEKISQSDGINSILKPVSGDEREKEISRLLSGQEDSSVAKEHAKELIALTLSD